VRKAATIIALWIFAVLNQSCTRHTIVSNETPNHGVWVEEEIGFLWFWTGSVYFCTARTLVRPQISKPVCIEATNYEKFNLALQEMEAQASSK
jgi:hypothetical protein